MAQEVSMAGLPGIKVFFTGIVGNDVGKAVGYQIW